MRQFLDRVTVTGADNSVEREDMRAIQKRFPFVEWGILLSSSAEGNRSRFPSRDWINHLVEGHEHYADEYRFKLAGHLCGRWVGHICKGNWTFFEERPDYCGYFDRLQLNFHGQKRKVSDNFIESFKHPVLLREGIGYPQVEVIFQLDGDNNGLYEMALEADHIQAVGLYDISHGAGVLPEEWPTGLYPDSLIGYAGGLSPENVEEQIIKLEKVEKGPCWIDAETHLRSDDDQQFDLDKVARFLEIAEPWVIQ